MRLREAPDDLYALIDSTSESLGLPLAFVEKDYWITELLRSVATPLEGASAVFKGGTSLSKGFGLLSRFSEDVDILLVPDGEMGTQAKDRLLKEVCSRGADALGMSVEDTRTLTSGQGTHRKVVYPYPARFDSDAITQGVILEIGVRGGPEPRQTCHVTSFVAQYATTVAGVSEDEFEEFAPIAVETLNPERTLIEKLSLLHHLGVTYPESDSRIRSNGRHLYDIERLLSHEPTTQALAPVGAASQLAEDVCRWSERAGWSFSPRPDSGYAASPIFETAHPASEALRSAFDSIRPLVFGPMREFNDCVARVHDCSALL